MMSDKEWSKEMDALKIMIGSLTREVKDLKKKKKREKAEG